MLTKLSLAEAAPSPPDESPVEAEAVAVRCFGDDIAETLPFIDSPSHQSTRCAAAQSGDDAASAVSSTTKQETENVDADADAICHVRWRVGASAAPAG